MRARWQPNAALVSSRLSRASSPTFFHRKLATYGDFGRRISMYSDDPPQFVLDDKRFSIDCKPVGPVDGKGLGRIDNLKRLRFAVPAHAKGKVVLGVDQPGIARDGREQ